jgi:FtsP/CotA-like multicopper oxidase with cupredoxin domain
MDHCILQGTTEEWLINNNNVPGGPSGWTHPVHIHFEEFRILQKFVRDPANPTQSIPVPTPPLQTGRKDVIRVNAGDSALIKIQMRDYLGRYLIHCHNMNHEDAFMMARWDIVSTPQQLCDNREQMIKNRKEAGVDVAAGLPTGKDGKKEGLA